MPEKIFNNQCTVLIVEDNPSNIMVVTLFLEQYGYKYDVVYNGEQAIESAKNKQYHTIIMDVQMQGINGLEATRHIRQHEEERGLNPTPIIGMTAMALSGDKERCLEVGMDDYISKPFNPDELEQKLLKFTRLSRQAA